MKQDIQIKEYETTWLDTSQISDIDAFKLYLKYSSKVNIDWPSPKTQNKYQLRSGGWVGYIPISENQGISILPKVPLDNLFGMLEYAYDLKAIEILNDSFECKTIRDFFERLAIILSNGLIKRARNGLYKTYFQKNENLPFLRGSLDIARISRKPILNNVPCRYEDHTLDIEENQIIAWTLYSILRSGICTERSLPIIRKADRILRYSVSLKPFFSYQCLNRLYNRLNYDYEILIKLCSFFLDHLGPTHDIGDRTMVPFMVDMSKLFELFVARWIINNISSYYSVKIQKPFTIGEDGCLKLIMDILVQDKLNKKNVLVIDTKYKAYGAVENADYNQVVAYSDLIGCKNAILIYPKNLDIPLNVKPGNVRVQSIAFDIGGDLKDAGNKMITELHKCLQKIE